jgi:hypothetical protein
MPLNYQVPDTLHYSNPVTSLDGDLEWVRFTPISGQRFNQGQTIDINVNSDVDWLSQKTYLKYDLKLTGAGALTGSASAVTTALGGASVIRCVTETASGVQVSRLDHYNTLLSSNYKKLPATQKAALRELEGLGNQTMISTTSTIANGRTICHAVRSSTLETAERLIPLAMVQSGITYSFDLDSLDKLIVSNAVAGITGYEVSNVELVVGLLKLSEKQVVEYNNKMNSGYVAKIPIKLVTNYRSTPTDVLDQTTIINTRYHQSLRDVVHIEKLNSVVGSMTTDEFQSETLNKLARYSYSIGSRPFPKMNMIRCNNDPALGPVSPEYIMQQMCAIDNSYASYDCPTAITANSSESTGYCFASNLSFGAGVPISDGILTMNRVYGATPSPSVLDTFITYDAVLSISNQGVRVDSESL